MSDITKFSQTVFGFTKILEPDIVGTWPKSWYPLDHQIVELCSIYFLLVSDAVVTPRTLRIQIGSGVHPRLYFCPNYAILASQTWHINLFPGATEEWFPGAVGYTTLPLPPGHIFYPLDGILIDMPVGSVNSEITDLTVSGKLWTL